MLWLGCYRTNPAHMPETGKCARKDTLGSSQWLLLCILEPEPLRVATGDDTKILISRMLDSHWDGLRASPCVYFWVWSILSGEGEHGVLGHVVPRHVIARAYTCPTVDVNFS